MSIPRSLSTIGGCLVVALLLAGCGSSENNNTTQPKVTWADQGWTAEERTYWHTLSVGQAFAPLSWYKSLERVDGKGSILDADYLARLGFMVEESSPHGLPIGFAVAPKGSPVEGFVGTSCAACHTGQLTYQGKTLRFDGASFNGDIVAFYSDFIMALYATYSDPVKFQRFSDSVAQHDGTSVAKVKDQVASFLAAADTSGQAYAAAPGVEVAAGPGRADAFNRIGNNLFGDRLNESSNYHKSNAPSNYPPLWDVWKFKWVHYNASFGQLMARNILQVLGNGGATNFMDASGNMVAEPERWRTSIDFRGASELERGYRTVRAPKWPEAMLGKVDRSQAQQGRALFEENCSSCHAARPFADPVRAMAVLDVKIEPLATIATDRAHAATFDERRYNATKLKDQAVVSITGPQGLVYLIDKIKNYGYDLLGLSPAERNEMDGFSRPNEIQAVLGYKARTLEGIWATPPYLHNGSVPNMYELLSPVAERSRTFWTGGHDYDPIKMGYVSSQTDANFFKFDTQIDGNRNTGHEFSNTGGNGVIGRALSHSERMQIIEYLKVLDQMPPDPRPQ